MAKSSRDKSPAPQLSLMDLPRRPAPAAAPVRAEPPPTAAVPVRPEPVRPEPVRPEPLRPAPEPVRPAPQPEPEPEPVQRDDNRSETPLQPATDLNKPARRATAESMAQKQREISISEFFTKNRHLLGFDNPSKALLTTVKEAVDNSLDACEEAGILPELEVEITELGGDRYRIAVEDNGPGIVKQQIPKVFGKLLYGSKFHRLKQSRGQQGIGISAAVMYGQLTTGKRARVLSRTGKGKPAHEFLIGIDTRKNAPDFTDRELSWVRPRGLPGTPLEEKEHGTRVEIELTANYVNGQRSVLRYLEQTALANPHATLRYLRPRQPGLEFPRSTHDLPRESQEIKPHPHGIELGALMQMLKETEEVTLTSFLQHAFSRVGPKNAEEILQAAALGPRAKPHALQRDDIERLHRAMGEAKLLAPPTNCLSPIGDELMRRGLVTFLSVIETEGPELDQEAIAREAQLSLDAAKKSKAAKAATAAAPSQPAAQPSAATPQNAPQPGPEGAAQPDGSAPQQASLPGTETPAAAPVEEGEEIIKGHKYFLSTVTRPPRVYRGNPFQVEVGLAYGGSWPADRSIELYRMANRVPLLFQRGACGVTDAVVRTDWRNYGLSQPRGGLPVAPMAVLVHIASVWVPFTSESKEAIAHYPEILEEIKKALQECGRKLATHLRKRKNAENEAKRRGLFEMYIEELAQSLHELTGKPRDEIKEQFTLMAHEVTKGADFEKELEAEEARNHAKPKGAKKKSGATKDEDE